MNILLSGAVSITKIFVFSVWQENVFIYLYLCVLHSSGSIQTQSQTMICQNTEPERKIFFPYARLSIWGCDLIYDIYIISGGGGVLKSYFLNTHRKLPVVFATFLTEQKLLKLMTIMGINGVHELQLNTNTSWIFYLWIPMLLTTLFFKIQFYHYVII